LSLARPLKCRLVARRAGRRDHSPGRGGNSQFEHLLFRRGEPRFYAFDLLHSDGQDLRSPKKQAELATDSAGTHDACWFYLRQPDL